MNGQRDDESGQYQRVYSDDEILNLLAEHRLATAEVADELECHRTTAHQRLKELEEEGLVSASKAGSTLIWESEKPR